MAAGHMVWLASKSIAWGVAAACAFVLTERVEFMQRFAEE
jgi:hypothetical protein